MKVAAVARKPDPRKRAEEALPYTTISIFLSGFPAGEDPACVIVDRGSDGCLSPERVPMTHGPAIATTAQRTRGLLFLCCLWAFAAGAQPSLTVPPRVAPGKYPVACSNVAQDFARLLPGEDVQDYWEGVSRADGTPRYITSLLSEPAAAVNALVRVPADTDLYGSFAGTTMPYVMIVCYPTAADNSRPDYPLPNGKSVPKMQRGGDAPWWPDAVTRFPILLFSHGYLGSPISNDYIDAVALLASYGYVVVAPLHGDGRFGSLKLEDLGDIA